MPRVRSKVNGNGELSKYRFCKIRGQRIFKGICEEVCVDKKCSIVRIRLDAQREKKKEANLRRRKKEIAKEQKKLDNMGVTRNILLRPEDREDV